MNKKQEVGSRKYSVPAVENAFEILKILSRKSYSESTITEIANKLSLSTASCFRILRVLEELAVVRYKKEIKKYTLGPYLIALGDRAKSHLDYISIIQPYLKHLTFETGLTSVLVNRVGDDKLTIISKEEGSDYGVHVSIGRHFSITDGAYGKCFLAYLDVEDRGNHLRREQGLKSYSEEEIALLEEEFTHIRQVGYSFTFGEYIKGIFGIAAPIFIDEDMPEMSIALIGLTAQVDKTELISLGELIKSAANEITKSIRPF